MRLLNLTFQQFNYDKNNTVSINFSFKIVKNIHKSNTISIIFPIKVVKKKITKIVRELDPSLEDGTTHY